MREIRFGLLEGHDVRFYAKPDITLVQMRCARKHLNDREHQKLENYVKQLTEELEELESMVSNLKYELKLKERELSNKRDELIAIENKFSGGDK